MYLTYEEYLTFGGSLTETEFDNLSFEAAIAINHATFNRLIMDTIIPEEVKKLVMVLISIAHKKAEALILGHSPSNAFSGYITTQSNDGVSTSYTGISPTDLYRLCEKEISLTIQKYLYGVKNSLGRLVLYRGLYSDE